jgi:hypothetical protein
MSFTDDETLLNNINLDSISQYKQFIDELKPLMLDQSGYSEVTDPKFAEGLTPLQAKLDRYNQRLDEIPKQLAALADKGTENWTDSDTSLYNALNKETSDITDPNNGGLVKINQQIAAYKSNTPQKRLDKTPERAALEKRFNSLQDAELSALEEQVNYYNSDEGKKLLDNQRKNVASQSALSAAQLQRQQDALDGKIGVSDVLSKQIQDQFNTFKEAQARNGNVIMGDSLDSAVAKGSSAQEALRAFQDNAKAAVQREKEAVIQGEGGITQQGLNLSSGLTAGSLQFGSPGSFTGRDPVYNNAMPGAPNYAGVSGMTASAAQPYQFQNQLQFNYDQLAAQRRGSGSGRSGLIGSMAGAGIGGLLAAPTGGMSIPMGMMLGSQFGGSAGLMFG